MLCLHLLCCGFDNACKDGDILVDLPKPLFYHANLFPLLCLQSTNMGCLFITQKLVELLKLCLDLFFCVMCLSLKQKCTGILLFDSIIIIIIIIQLTHLPVPQLRQHYRRTYTCTDIL